MKRLRMVMFCGSKNVCLQIIMYGNHKVPYVDSFSHLTQGRYVIIVVNTKANIKTTNNETLLRGLLLK